MTSSFKKGYNAQNAGLVFPVPFVDFITNLPYHEVISHKMCTNDAIKTILGRFGPQGVPHL